MSSFRNEAVSTPQNIIVCTVKMGQFNDPDTHNAASCLVHLMPFGHLTMHEHRTFDVGGSYRLAATCQVPCNDTQSMGISAYEFTVLKFTFQRTTFGFSNALGHHHRQHHNYTIFVPKCKGGTTMIFVIRDQLFSLSLTTPIVYQKFRNLTRGVGVFFYEKKRRKTHR